MYKYIPEKSTCMRQRSVLLSKARQHVPFAFRYLNVILVLYMYIYCHCTFTCIIIIHVHVLSLYKYMYMYYHCTFTCIIIVYMYLVALICGTIGIVSSGTAPSNKHIKNNNIEHTPVQVSAYLTDSSSEIYKKDIKWSS